jgi:predicted RNA-binding Zn ribbon-like protein
MLFQDPGGRLSAPEPLRFAQAFVNTLDLEHEVDLFSGAAALREVLCEIGAGDVGPLTERDLCTALSTREAVRALALVNSGFPLPADVPDVLERVARAARYTLRMDGSARLRLVPTAGGLDGVLGRVLAVVHEAMVDGTWPRLKGCPRDVCHWLFYDRSRNGSSKWCAMSVCGNRTNTKRYRARHAA